MLIPLQFNPVFKNKIWGGRALEKVLGKSLPENIAIGESWEISGLKDCESVSITQPYYGKKISEILSENKQDLLGIYTRYEEFPLLYKFIDAKQKLSVQVHPDDAWVCANELGFFGKNECWYIVDAKNDSKIICGLKKGITRKILEKAIISNKIEEVLNFVDVSPGDVIFIPARTIHAVLGGILFYELQQSSDITFRLYDWNRLDNNKVARKLHIEEALNILDTTFNNYYKIPPVIFEETSSYIHFFRIACRYFALEEYKFLKDSEISLPVKRSFRVITVLSNNVKLLFDNSSINLLKGSTTLIPACVTGLKAIASSGTHFLLSYVPDLLTEVVAPLSVKKIPRENIVLLGGNPATSDLGIF